jgi:hypothetical protein
LAGCRCRREGRKSVSGIGILMMQLQRVMSSKVCLGSMPYTKQVKTSVSVKGTKLQKIIFGSPAAAVQHASDSMVDWTLAFSAEAASTPRFAVQSSTVQADARVYFGPKTQLSLAANAWLEACRGRCGHCFISYSTVRSTALAFFRIGK